MRRLPFSYRVLLSGYMPEYFYGVGYLDQRYPLEELRALGYVSERGRLAGASPTYSTDIRRGIPPLDRGETARPRGLLRRRLVLLGCLTLLVGGLLGRRGLGRLLFGFGSGRSLLLRPLLGLRLRLALRFGAASCCCLDRSAAACAPLRFASAAASCCSQSTSLIISPRILRRGIRRQLTV